MLLPSSPPRSCGWLHGNTSSNLCKVNAPCEQKPSGDKMRYRIPNARLIIVATIAVCALLSASFFTACSPSERNPATIPPQGTLAWRMTQEEVKTIASSFLPESSLATAEIEIGRQFSDFTGERVWWVNCWGLNVERAQLAWQTLVYTEYSGPGPYNHVMVWLLDSDGTLYYKIADVGFKAN